MSHQAPLPPCPLPVLSGVEGPHAPVPPANAVSSLESITGLDVESGIRRVAGKRDFYEKLIRQFCDGEESRSVETVRSQLADSQHEDAERTAHSLKGVAGTLGAQEIQSRAEGLETAIREQHTEAEIESHLASVQQELDRLIGDIRNALGVEATVEASANDKATFDPTTVADLPGLLEVLKAEKDNVQELSSTLTINGIEDFATRMKTLGQHHGCPAVEQWADHLTDAAGTLLTCSGCTVPRPPPGSIVWGLSHFSGAAPWLSSPRTARPSRLHRVAH